MRKPCPYALFFLLGLVPSVTAGAKAERAGIDFFEQKIRPVLVEHCYKCHSAEAQQAGKLKADLLLDSRAGMLHGGDSGPVLVAGKPADSLILKSLRHEGDVRMPPGKRLSEAVIGDFSKWVAMGAPDPRTGDTLVKKGIAIDKARTYWAFRPLAASAPPVVKNLAWARTPLDRFILAKLEEKKLGPNKLTSRERLIRRAYFDLLGLPPTPAEVDAFVNDPAPDAYERLVDRLLESPHLGERWARHWLDLVRFAESGGYEFDKDRPTAHHYRDFVIKAFNQDLPFDQFVRWQLAGDQLAPENFDAVSATGFLVAGPFPGQTTAKTQQLIRYNHLDDMIATVGSSMLGLSLGCARCHEHKYDPIPQEDYYRLIANLSRTDSVDAKINVDPAGYRKAKAAFEQAHAPFHKALKHFEQAELPKRLQTWWEEHKDTAAPAWLIVDAVEAKGKSPLQQRPDGSLLATGKAEKNDTITLVAHTTQKNLKALRLEALTDPSLPKNGPGRGPDGAFLLTDVTLVATPLDPKVKAKPVTVKLRAATASTEEAKLAAAVDADKKTGWSIGAGKDQAAIFALEGAGGFDGGTLLTLTLRFENDQFALGRFRIGISTDAKAALDAPSELQPTAELLALLQATEGKVKPQAQGPMVHWLRKLDTKVDEVFRTFEQHARLEPQPKLVGVFSASSNKGGDVYFLVRGEVEKKREIAKPGFVQVLMNHGDGDQHWLGGPQGKKPATVEPRIALANWLTDHEHGAGHLLARVLVNRLWQHHLGRGIVGTPNDFGVQGEAPTHPELLDWLADELIRGGWKLKPIHKLIMTSAVYMQAGEIIPANMKVDPQNRLWWRRPARRLEAEAIRDAILAVAGTLDPRMFGPGTLDGNSPRRSVYLTVKRSQMIPLLQMFDIPEAMQSIGERSVTTVPTQSLAFMNSPFIRQAAQKLAARVRAKASASMNDAIDEAYLIALGRRPTEVERGRMLDFVERQAESYGKAAQARDQALTDCCQVLLCLNEFIFVD